MNARLLLLHGAMGSAAQFDGLQQQLGFETVAMDFVGHGAQPDVNEPWTIELFAAQLEQEIQRMPKPPSIFGYSMGGYIALWLALRLPDLVPRLITLGTKLDWTRQGAQADAAKVPHEKTAMMMVHLGANPLLTTNNVAGIQSEVRYMVGDADRMVSIEETHSFFRATPASQMVVLPNTQHQLHKVSMPRLAFELHDFVA